MDTINKYINNFIDFQNSEISRLEEEHKTRTDLAPCIEQQTASFLNWLIKLNCSKNIIEFGSCIGYSTIVLGEAVKETAGKVTSVEFCENHYWEAKENIEKSGLSEFITLINGDAYSEIEKFSDKSFDLILQDSMKSLYPKMLEICIKKLRDNGVFVADDALFKPMGRKKKFSDPIDQCNQMAFSDSRLDSTILNIGDGLLLSRKIN